MEIKTLTKSIIKNHLETILSIDRTQIKDAEKWNRENFLCQYPLKFNLSVVALEGKNIIGFTIATKKNKSCHIHRIAVSDKYTGRGLGSMMLQSIEKRAKDNKLEAVTVEALKKAKLKNFYLQNSFGLVPEEKLKVYAEQKDVKIRQQFLQNYYVFTRNLKIIVAIHQPYFMPWLGFFDKVAKSNTYIVLDNVSCDFKSKSFLNRNKIKTPQGAMWLSVPIQGGIHQLIKDVKIDSSSNWAKDHLKTLFYNYKKAPNFDKIYPLIEKIYHKKHLKLIDLNMEIINLFFNSLKVKTDIIYASDLRVKGKNNELLINLLTSIGSKEYISGMGAKNYLDEEYFKKNGLEVKWQEFNHPIYRQLWGEFAPNLSVLDYLFCDGRPLPRVDV